MEHGAEQATEWNILDFGFWETGSTDDLVSTRDSSPGSFGRVWPLQPARPQRGTRSIARRFPAIIYRGMKVVIANRYHEASV
jgi:hypothetical protein